MRGILTIGTALATLVATVPANAQSVGLTLGYLTLRGSASRSASDILVQDRTFLNFSFNDFRNASVGGEVVLPISDFFDAGFGVDFYRRTVPSNYTDFVKSGGGEITQRLRLQIVPLTATLRMLPLGRHTSIVPYVGGGAGALRWKYTESGEFVDFTDNSVFPGIFEGSGTKVGGIVVGGVSVPLAHSIAVSGELQYRKARADLPPADFATRTNPRPQIDLGGMAYRFGVHWRF